MMIKILRNSDQLKQNAETETQVAMKNIAKATTIVSAPLTEDVKEIKPIQITDEEVTTGRNLHKEP